MNGYMILLSKHAQWSCMWIAPLLNQFCYGQLLRSGRPLWQDRETQGNLSRRHACNGTSIEVNHACPGRGNAGKRWPKQQTDAVLQTLWAFERANDLSSLLGALAVPV